MKRMNYETPTMEVVKFETEDVIITSGHHGYIDPDQEGIELPIIPLY